jgi:two-component system chemotaxis sensor kinase CheA
MDEGRLLQQFVAESEGLIEALQVDLEELGRQQSSGRVNPNLLNSVFRSAHSLKGMAGMTGLPSVQHAAHRFEDLLDDMRMGRVETSAELIAGCAQIAGRLGHMIAAAGRGQTHDAEAERVEALVEAFRSGPEAGEAEDFAAFVDLDDPVRRTFTEYEEHRLRENLRERRALYDIRVAFSLDAFDTGFRALSDRLAASGEVISTLPGPAADSPLQIAFSIIYATDAPAGAVEAIASESGGSARLISRYPEAAPAVEEEEEPAGRLEPLASFVRVDIHALDDLAALAQRLALEVAGLAETSARLSRELDLGPREQFEVKQSARSVERGFAELEERLVDLRLVPLGPTFARARRLVAHAAAELGREAELEVEGEDVRLDKAIVDRISEPLAHLLHNAVDHGVEPPEARVTAGKPRVGRIALRAESLGNRVRIEVRDDGAGIDPDAVRRAAARRGVELPKGEGAAPLEAIFRPGVSTADAVSTISGRGVGLDAVASVVAELGGEISVASEPGRGSTFVLTLPATLLMVSAFLVESGGAPYAVDVTHLAELGLLAPEDVDTSGQRPTVAWRDARLPFYELGRLLERPPGARPGAAKLPCLIARAGERQAAVAVDRFLGEREVIVKSLGRLGPALRGVNGAVDLEGGRVALLLDLPALVAEPVASDAR